MGVGDEREPDETPGREEPVRKVVTPSHAATVPAKGSDRLARDRIRNPVPTVQVDPEEISGLIELAEVMVSQKIPGSDVVPLDADDKRTRKMDAEQFKQLLREERAVPVQGRAKTVEDITTTKALAAKTQAEPAPSGARKPPQTTAELMASVDEAFADFGPDEASPASAPSAPMIATASKPVEKPAPIATAPPAPPNQALAIPSQPSAETASKPAKKAAPIASPLPASQREELAIPSEPMVETASKPVKKPALIVEDHRVDTRFHGAIKAITKPPPIAEPPAEAPESSPVVVDLEPERASSSILLALISVLVVAIVVGVAIVLLR